VEVAFSVSLHVNPIYNCRCLFGVGVGNYKGLNKGGACVFFFRDRGQGIWYWLGKQRVVVFYLKIEEQELSLGGLVYGGGGLSMTCGFSKDMFLNDKKVMCASRSSRISIAMRRFGKGT